MAGSYWLTVLPDMGKFSKGVSDAAKDIKVEPSVEPKIDKGASRSVGESIASELGRQVGEAAISAGNRAAKSINNAIKNDGFVGAAQKISRSVTDGLKNIGPTAGKILTGGLGSAMAMAAPTVVGKLESALSKGLERVGSSNLASSLVGGLDQAQTKISGFVGGATDSLQGFQSILDDVESALGDDSFAAPALNALRGGLQQATPLLDGLSASTKIATGVQGAFNLVMRANPLGLIVTAIGAAVAGLTWFFTKTELGKKIWEQLVAAFQSTVSVVKNVFNGIVSAVSGVVDWIKDHWKLLPILAGPVGAAVSLVLTHWDKIKAGATAVWEWVSQKFTAVVNFVKGLPGKISAAAKGMWDGLQSGLKSVLNSIAGLWNSLADKLSFEVPSWVPGVGGKKWSLPKIPTFATGGGPIRGPGSSTSDSILAWLSNGEYVVNAASTRKFLPLLEAVNNAPGFAAGGLTPHASEIKQKIMAFWPSITDIGGYRPEDGYNEHSTGNALDVMIPGWDTPAGKALGDAVAGWALSNAEALGLSWVIWRQRIHNPGDEDGRMMEDRGSSTQNHMDHVHIFMNNAPDEKLKLSNPTLKGATSAPPPGPRSAPSASQGGISLGGSSSSGGSSLGSAVSGGDGSDVFGEMSDILKGGIKENLFGGTGLTDPMEWPNVKSAMAGLQFLLNLVGLQAPSGGASPYNPMSGSPALAAGDLNPAISGGSLPGGGPGLPGLSGFMPNAQPAEHGAAQGAAPGPTNNYNITTNESTQTVQKSVDAVRAANVRTPVTVPH